MQQHSEFAYLNALTAVQENGNNRLTRNGLTRAILAYQMRFNLQLGFMLLTTKKIQWDSVVAELLWFIDAGKETGRRLSLHKLNEIQGKPINAKNIWSHDQERFAKQGKAQFPGDCGRIYGAQWRNWRAYKFIPSGPVGCDNNIDTVIAPERTEVKEIDQLANVIAQIKKDPFSRYHIVSAWNPAELDDMCLPPCHMKMQFFVREIDGIQYLDLSMDQRSCDMFLGVPFNIASYALLVHMIAQCVDMQPGELIITLEDCHIYLAAIGKDGVLDYTQGHETQVREQLSRKPLTLPTIQLNPKIKDIDKFRMEDIQLLNYEHHAPIKAALL